MSIACKKGKALVEIFSQKKWISYLRKEIPQNSDKNTRRKNYMYANVMPISVKVYER